MNPEFNKRLSYPGGVHELLNILFSPGEGTRGDFLLFFVNRLLGPSIDRLTLVFDWLVALATEFPSPPDIEFSETVSVPSDLNAQGVGEAIRRIIKEGLGDEDLMGAIAGKLPGKVANYIALVCLKGFWPVGDPGRRRIEVSVPAAFFRLLDEKELGKILTALMRTGADPEIARKFVAAAYPASFLNEEVILSELARAFGSSRVYQQDKLIWQGVAGILKLMMQKPQPIDYDNDGTLPPYLGLITLVDFRTPSELLGLIPGERLTCGPIFSLIRPNNLAQLVNLMYIRNAGIDDQFGAWETGPLPLALERGAFFALLACRELEPEAAAMLIRRRAEKFPEEAALALAIFNEAYKYKISGERNLANLIKDKDFACLAGITHSVLGPREAVWYRDEFLRVPPQNLIGVEEKLPAADAYFKNVVMELSKWLGDNDKDFAVSIADLLVFAEAGAGGNSACRTTKSVVRRLKESGKNWNLILALMESRIRDSYLNSRDENTRRAAREIIQVIEMVLR